MDVHMRFGSGSRMGRQWLRRPRVRSIAPIFLASGWSAMDLNRFSGQASRLTYE